MWIRINWSCVGTERRLGEYLDGTLPLRRRRAVEAHLRTCVGCRHELASLRRTLALLNDLPRRELSDQFEAALHVRLEGIPAAGRRSSRTRFAMPALLQPSFRYLRAPWPSDLRRLAPLGAVAMVAAAVAAWNQQLPPVVTGHVPPPAPAYVSWVSHEHQMLTTGSDMNSTVVSHNLGGDSIGDGDEE